MSVYDRASNCDECGLLLSVGHAKECYLYRPPLPTAGQIDLDAIKERIAAAPPGPWSFTVEANRAADHDCELDYWTWEIGSDADEESVLGGSELDDPRAAVTFIAAARTDVPLLVAEVERLRAENTTARQMVRDMVYESANDRMRHALRGEL